MPAYYFHVDTHTNTSIQMWYRFLLLESHAQNWNSLSGNVSTQTSDFENRSTSTTVPHRMHINKYMSACVCTMYVSLCLELDASACVRACVRAVCIVVMLCVERARGRETERYRFAPQQGSIPTTISHEKLTACSLSSPTVTQPLTPPSYFVLFSRWNLYLCSPCEIFAYVTVFFFNPTIKVVTFRLRMPAFTRLGHERVSPCDEMLHRLDLGLYSHRRSFWGNGVWTHVNSKGKIPSTKNVPRGGWHCGQRAQVELFRPPVDG